VEDAEAEAGAEVLLELALLRLASHVMKKDILPGTVLRSLKERKLTLLPCVKRRSSIATSVDRKVTTPEIVPLLLRRNRKLLLKDRKNRLQLHAPEHLVPRSPRPALTVEMQDISSVIALKPLLVRPRRHQPEVANVEEQRLAPLAKRKHPVLATTVVKKVILRAIAPTKPSNSLKDRELVVVPVEAATEDAPRLVTDVELKTTWFAIVLSQT
jgi:hypothetical protein